MSTSDPSSIRIPDWVPERVRQETKAGYLSGRELSIWPVIHEELFGYLSRLLTDERMKTVWTRFRLDVSDRPHMRDYDSWRFFSAAFSPAKGFVLFDSSTATERKDYFRKVKALSLELSELVAPAALRDEIVFASTLPSTEVSKTLEQKFTLVHRNTSIATSEEILQLSNTLCKIAEKANTALHEPAVPPANCKA